MKEINVIISRLPPDSETPVEVTGLPQALLFDRDEIDLLAAGQSVRFETGEAVFVMTAPLLVVLFNSRRPELAESRLSGWDVDRLRKDAKAFAAATVGAENAHRHDFNIVTADAVPEWHGKAEPRRVRREKDDVCAWQHVTGF